MARTRTLPVEIYDRFDGGLNDFMSAAKIAKNESPDLQNIELTENGIPSKRRGTDVYGNAVNSRVLGLGSLYTTSVRRHLQVSGTSLYYYNAGTWTSISGATFTADKNVNFVQANNAIYAHNGTDSMRKYDGTTLSAPANGATGKFGIYYAGRNIIAGNATNPSRLYMSSSKSADNFTGKTGTATSGSTTTIVDSGQSWTTNEFAGLTVQITAGTNAGTSRTVISNTSDTLTVSTAYSAAIDSTSQYSIEGGDTIDIARNDGQKITGLAKFEEKLIIFKDFSIYQLTFDSAGFPTVQLINGANGCVSHRSIEAVENDLFFLSHDGVRSFGYVPNIANVIRTNILSAKISGKIGNINTTYYEQCASIYHDNMWMLSYPEGSSTTNNAIVVFQLLYGAWVYWKGINANCFNEFIDTDNMVNLYYGADDEGQTYKMLTNNYTDGVGTAIDAYWYSPQYDLGTFNRRKRFPFVDIQVRALTGTLGIDIILDGSVTAKTAELASTFSAQDGYRSGAKYRTSQMYRESNGSTASTVTVDDVRRIRLNKTARTVQVKTYNANASENFTLMALGIGNRIRSPYSFDSNKIIT